MRAGTVYALSVSMLTLLFSAGFLLMAFPKSKALVELGLFIVVVALFIAAPIVYLLVQKYGLSLVAT